MVYTVTLNPALDLYLAPEAFAPGEVCRYDTAQYVPGGKGINVSILLSRLGMDTAAGGFIAGFTGRELKRLLEASGCPTDFAELKDGLTRVNVKILSQPETALNGDGPDIGLLEVRPIIDRVSALREGDFLVLAGSVPPSLMGLAYAYLMTFAPKGVQVIVDAYGGMLLEAVNKRPFLVKPNLEELGETFGADCQGPEDAVKCARWLQEMGARNVAVTLGGSGAVLLTEDGGIARRPAIPGKEVSSVGAGDSFIAGYIYGYIKEGSHAAALDWAMCAGAATAFTQGIAQAEDVLGLYEKYTI